LDLISGFDSVPEDEFNFVSLDFYFLMELKLWNETNYSLIFDLTLESMIH